MVSNDRWSHPRCDMVISSHYQNTTTSTHHTQTHIFWLIVRFQFGTFWPSSHISTSLPSGPSFSPVLVRRFSGSLYVTYFPIGIKINWAEASLSHPVLCRTTRSFGGEAAGAIPALPLPRCISNCGAPLSSDKIVRNPFHMHPASGRNLRCVEPLYYYFFLFKLISGKNWVGIGN